MNNGWKSTSLSASLFDIENSIHKIPHSNINETHTSKNILGSFDNLNLELTKQIDSVGSEALRQLELRKKEKIYKKLDDKNVSGSKNVLMTHIMIEHDKDVNHLDIFTSGKKINGKGQKIKNGGSQKSNKRQEKNLKRGEAYADKIKNIYPETKSKKKI